MSFVPWTCAYLSLQPSKGVGKAAHSGVAEKEGSVARLARGARQKGARESRVDTGSTQVRRGLG